MMHHPIKCGCQKICGSADMVEIVIFDKMSPPLWPWTWRQQTNLLAWHFGLWCCITITSLVTEGSAAEEISSKWTITGILNLFCDLDLDNNRAIWSFHKTNHLMILYYQTKFSCKKISSSDIILKSCILILSLTVTLILNKTVQSLHKTLQHMMCHPTNFGCKMISCSANMVETITLY